MMKQLFFINLLFASSIIFAQDCVINENQGPFIADPDGTYLIQLSESNEINSNQSTFNANFDTLRALPHAVAGQLFSQSFGVRIPVDTSIVIDPADIGLGDVLGEGPQLFEGVNILSLVITDIQGLPMGFDFSCDNDQCQWSSADYGCVSLYSTDAVDAALAGDGIQAYPLDFILNLDVSYTLFVPLTFEDVEVANFLNYYVLIVESDNSSNSEIVDSRSFRHFGTIPNPAMNNCTIQYGNDTNTNVDFKLFDVLGNLVYSNNYKSSIGYNEINLNIQELHSGIYTFTISDKNNIITKRIIVK